MTTHSRGICALLVILALQSFSLSSAVAETGPTSAPLIFYSDFEPGPNGFDRWGISGNAPAVTSEVARAGRHAMKTVLNRRTSRTSYRTEVTSSAAVDVNPGEEYWYGFSVYLPHDYVPDPIWEIVAQWHSSPDNPEEHRNAPNPPLALYTDNGEWSVSLIWDAKPITDKKAGYDGNRNFSIGKYATGRWTDWVFRVKWSHRSDGLLQVWKDGELVIDHKGPVGFNDQKGPYFKIGLYKGWKDRTDPPGAVSERVLYHDEVRIAGPGGRYEDVAPGGSNGYVRRPSPPRVRLE